MPCGEINPSNKMLHTRDVADLFGVSDRTVEGWRARKTGPAYHRFEGRVRYALEDVLDWKRRCRVSDVRAVDDREAASGLDRVPCIQSDPRSA